jgi:hypothetical protein
MRLTTPLATALVILATAASHADMVPFYIGVDGRTTIPSGTYAGLADPNGGRLTFLYNHGNHYHAKAVYTYTGPNLGAATEVTVSPSNYVPEGSAPPFAMEPGSGAFAGLYVSGPASDVEIGSVEALRGAAPGSDETILLDSSGGRWNGSIADAELVIELVGATSGLSILDASGLPVFAGGTSLALGLADASLRFAPIFAAAAPGDYVAQFRVHDARADGFDSSGVFEIRFNAAAAAVPEPGSLVMASIAGLAASAAALRGRLRRPGRTA